MKLSDIYIRAKGMDGKWGSYSLQELYATGGADQIAHWFKSKINELLGIQEGDLMREDHVERMVEMLEKCGTKIHRQQ